MPKITHEHTQLHTNSHTIQYFPHKLKKTRTNLNKSTHKSIIPEQIKVKLGDSARLL